MRPPAGRIPKPRVPRVGRPEGRFTQHRRLDKLRELLENNPRGLTLEQLATLLRVTPRSVRRYLRELDGAAASGQIDKYELLESLEPAKGAAHVWRIRPRERTRAVTLRRGQAYAILATRRALDLLKGSALFVDADLAFADVEKITQIPNRARGGRAQISAERKLEGRFFWLPPASRSYPGRGEDIDELFRAVAELLVLRYRPRTPAGAPRPESVELHPYAMVVHKGSIVCVGARRQARPDAGAEVIPFEAMTELRALEDEHFELPATFDVNHYVHGEFGVARPTKVRAVVHFDARVADEIRKKKLHPEQSIATRSDGRLRLTMPLADQDAFIAWALSFGDTATVVEPPDVARQLADILERAAARYR